MSAHVLLPLSVNSKPERKVNSLPPLGFELVIFGMLAHLSNYLTKSHPTIIDVMGVFLLYFAISATMTLCSRSSRGTI
jgi:hypothetical protein